MNSPSTFTGPIDSPSLKPKTLKELVALMEAAPKIPEVPAIFVRAEVIDQYRGPDGVTGKELARGVPLYRIDGWGGTFYISETHPLFKFWIGNHKYPREFPFGW